MASGRLRPSSIQSRGGLAGGYNGPVCDITPSLSLWYTKKTPWPKKRPGTKPGTTGAKISGLQPRHMRVQLVYCV
jgi:hypothetical protein